MTKSRGTRSPLFSLRLSDEERARLTLAAGGSPIATYIKRQLIGDAPQGTRARRASPVRDARLLAQMLSRLGGSPLAGALHDLSEAAKSGSVFWDEVTGALVAEACADVRAMRLMLMRALGLRPEDDAADAAPPLALSAVFNGDAGADRS